MPIKAVYDKHYKSLRPEPLEVIEGWGLGFHAGNCIKYIARSPLKGSEIADLEKAVFYLKRYLGLRKKELNVRKL